MKAVAVLAVCLALVGSVPATDADRTVVVWPEELHDGEYWVPYLVHGQYGVARCGTRAEAQRLYSVLAGVMVGGEQ